jgi:curved DNA-binding protein CbpA
MSDEQQPVDYYELLQLSPNADPETIHRVYRVLAQRLHPDNQESGDATRFRELTEAYHVLSTPELRAKYDVGYHQTRQDRWRLVTSGAEADNNVEIEQVVRLTVLEVLYTRRRMEPADPGIFNLDLAELIGRPREHLEFTIWYLIQKELVQRSDNSRLAITAEGVDYLERHYHVAGRRRQLKAATVAVN